MRFPFVMFFFVRPTIFFSFFFTLVSSKDVQCQCWRKMCVDIFVNHICFIVDDKRETSTSKETFLDISVRKEEKRRQHHHHRQREQRILIILERRRREEKTGQQIQIVKSSHFIRREKL